MFLRILVVLTASTVGLGAGSLFYYTFIEDRMIYRGSAKAELNSNICFGLSITFFLITVYLLHLNQFTPLLISAAGMMLTKLLWNCGDGFRYAAMIYKILADINNSTEALKQFLKRADNYRQIQDLRAVAHTMFAADSRQLAFLNDLIEQEYSEKS